MKFGQATIIELVRKTEKAYGVRVSKGDRVFHFLCFDQKTIDLLKTKKDQTVDLDIYPLQENEYKGHRNPSTVFVGGLWKPRKKDEEATQPPEQNGDGDLPF